MRRVSDVPKLQRHRPTRSLVGTALVATVTFALVACGGHGLDAAAPTPERAATDDRSPTTEPETPPTDDSQPNAGSSDESDDTQGQGEKEASSIRWEPCADDPEAECATIAVPLDWESPDGDTIPIEVARYAATGRRDGAVFTNPGGPGASGVDFLIGSQGLSLELREHFDVVSWDPRGAGDSGALNCGGNVDEFLALDSSPDDQDERTKLDAAAKRVADDCAEYRELLGSVGTDNAVLDMNAIRAAMGDDVVHYLGFSYGTLIGVRALANTEVASHLGRVVLDGVVDPTQTLAELLAGQATVFEGLLDGDAELTAAYDELAKRVETEPLEADPRPVGPSELATAAISATYGAGGLDELKGALNDALAGDGNGIARLADDYYAFGAYPAYAAVTCLDSPIPDGAAGWDKLVQDLTKIAPRLGASIANELRPCAYWPVEPQPVIGPAPTVDRDEPVLVVGTTGDAATPVENAKRVASALGDAKLLLTDGVHHTAFGQDSCASDVINRYLVDGTTPDDDACT